MKRRTVTTLALFAIGLPVALRAEGSVERVDFSGYRLGKLPPEFGDSWRTGSGAPSDRRVIDDPTASQGKAIAQLSDEATDHRFPLAVYKPFAVQDVETSVRFKAVAGRVDRAGGLAVRLTGPDNYYVVRANAVEDNVNFYRVLKGRRQQIKGTAVKVSAGEWHTLTLRAEGDRFVISFERKPLVTAADKTFGSVGKIAPWTKNGFSHAFATASHTTGELRSWGSRSLGAMAAGGGDRGPERLEQGRRRTRQSRCGDAGQI
jgi:hypothetical protein